MDAASLARAVRGVEPSALLVPAWWLRKLIAADCGGNGSTFFMLRSSAHAIDRARLLALAEERDLPISLDGELVAGPMVYLLVEPEVDWLASTPAGTALLQYWRLLFHARVYGAVRQALAGSVAAARQRIGRLGRSEFNDARFVLQKERYLPWSANECEAYARFAAVYLELEHFAPASLPRWFAAVHDRADALRILSGDVDADGVWRQTRLEGADGDVTDRTAAAVAADAADASAEDAEEGAATDADAASRPDLLGRAARAAAVGNVIRATILQVRALGRSGAPADPAVAGLLDQLVERLKSALLLDDTELAQWRTSLWPLLPHAAGRWWNPESRILYDLQKVCIDHERQVYALDTLRWLFSFGRHPLQRPLPAQRLVLICKHLRSAMRRLPRARLAEADRAQLLKLLEAAHSAAEARLHHALEPLVTDALHRGGLVPQDAIEQVAQRKLVAEFIDGLVRRGFATMGDLRDALSRNQLKLHDLHGVAQFAAGDQLLQIDRHLDRSLSGVYHRGEAYLRLFQRISSLAFATRVGRLATYYLLMPFGGAFLVLEGLDHTLGVLLGKVFGFHVTFDHLSTVLVLGTFLLALINSAAFRRVVVGFAGTLSGAIGWLLVDVPRRLVNDPILRRVLASRALRVLWRWGMRPAMVTAVAWLLIRGRATPTASAIVLSAVFVAANLLLNSRAGRVLEQVVLHATLVLWTRLAADVLAGLFHWVVRFFRALLESLERVLYAVDEWLRFRSGQGRLSLAGKAMVGVVWGGVIYLTRFGITLLAEPQINPIKHFPVVTVSHKIILPTVPLMAMALQGVGMGKVESNTVATTIAFLIPGIFGFLAWELKENWKLYRANRSGTLRPVQVGHHGETLAQLLRPGFHSGTIPKLFARLRRADGREPSRRSRAHIRKHLTGLEHVREAIEQFVQHDLLALLNGHPAWAATPVALGEVTLAATQIRLSLECPTLGERPASLLFEQQNGWILAGIEEPGWMAAADPAQRQVLSMAILGLYKMCRVDVVREQIDSLFGAQRLEYEFRRRELVLWQIPEAGELEATYDLRQDTMPPPTNGSAADLSLPTLDSTKLFLRHTDVAWDAWVSLWQPDAQLPAPSTEASPWPNVRVLPDPIAPAAWTAESMLAETASTPITPADVHKS